MMKKSGILLFMFLTSITTIAQNKLFKGQNLLMPSNLIVNYTVRLDTCYRMVKGECTDAVSKAYLSNKQKLDLIDLIVWDALLGYVKCYKADSWVTYQILENRKPLSEKELEKILDLTKNELDLKEFIGLNFIEEWKVTENPLSFEKNIIAYMPLRRYYKDNDVCLYNPLYQTPFAIIDTLEKKSQIKKSNKRMLLTNEIESEYFFNLDYTLPYDIDELTKTYKKSKQGAGDYLLKKENSEYLSKTGVVNFMEVLIGKVIKGELTAYDYSNNYLLTVNEVEAKLGAVKDTAAIGNPNGTYSLNYAMPMDFEDIQSIVFLENWFIDPETLRMKKKIVGIAPVKNFYFENDEYEEHLKREILFKIYID